VAIVRHALLPRLTNSHRDDLTYPLPAESRHVGCIHMPCCSSSHSLQLEAEHRQCDLSARWRCSPQSHSHKNSTKRVLPSDLQALGREGHGVLCKSLTSSSSSHVVVARRRAVSVFPTPLGPSIAMAGASGSSSSSSRSTVLGRYSMLLTLPFAQFLRYHLHTSYAIISASRDCPSATSIPVRHPQYPLAFPSHPGVPPTHPGELP